MDIIHPRSPLVRSRRAIDAGQITVGFIGGSITDGRSLNNWPLPVAAWLTDRFPKTRIRVENAAIGATNSQLAAFRAQRDLLDRGCDLVFVEYAVNDFGLATEARNRSREGLLRQLLSAGMDVVLVYTFSHPMYDDMREGRTPATIAEFESLAAHYDLSSVWMGLNAMQEVERGLMRWEEWLPDGLHPTQRGSLSYAQAVIRYLEQALADDAPSTATDRRLPAPLNGNNWQFPQRVTFETIARTGPWQEERSVTNTWVDLWLSSVAPQAELAWRGSGHTAVIGFDFGKSAADFRYQIDGGDWQDPALERPDWMPEHGWLRLVVLSDSLSDGEHELRIQTRHPGFSAKAGANFRLAFAGFV